jgi:hypothetical protein
MEATTVGPLESTATGRRAHRHGQTGARPQQGSGAVYALGMVGALVYFARAAQSPRDYAVAAGKALVWPAILVYLALRKLDA